MSEDSRGTRTPLVVQETMPEIEGIVIVAEGEMMQEWHKCYQRHHKPLLMYQLIK